MAEKKAAKAAENKEVGVKEVNRLKKRYTEEVVPALKKRFDYKNVNRIPKLEKIVVNAGIGDAKDNSKSFQIAVEELKSITGQKPLVTHAEKIRRKLQAQRRSARRRKGDFEKRQDVRVYG